MSLFKTYLNLAGILNRIETELCRKASTAEVGVLTARLNAKADTKATGVTLATLEARLNTLEGIIGGKATIADLSQAKIDLGVRIDDLEKEVETLALNAVKTELSGDREAHTLDLAALDRVIQSSRPVADIDHLVKAPKKPRAPKGGGK